MADEIVRNQPEDEDIVDNFGEGGGEDEQTPDVPEETVVERVEEVVEHDGGGDDIPAAVPEEEGEDEGGAEEVEFSPELLRASGYREDEARASFSNPKELADAVRRMDQQLINQRPNITPANQPQAIQPASTQQDETDWTLPEPAEGGDWDEDTKKLFESQKAAFRRELERRDQILQQQQEQLQAINARQQQAEQQAYIDDFEGFIEALGPEWSHVFGQGNYRNLNPQGIAMRNRVHLMDVSNRLEQSLADAGMGVQDRDEVRVRALRAAFPDVSERQIHDQVQKQVVSRSNLVTNRPTNRRTAANLSGEQKAIARVEQFWRDRGVTPEISEEEYSEI